MRRAWLVRSEHGVWRDYRPATNYANAVTYVELRAACTDDVGVLARLHRATLPDAFLPTLGQRFLRVFYEALVTDSGTVAMVAVTDGQVVGFGVGILSTREFARAFLRTHGLRAAAAAGPRLLHRRAIVGAIETRRAAMGLPRLPESQLLVLGVDRDRQSEGIGGRIAGALIAELAGRGAAEVAVVTPAANTPANRFFKGLGFRRTAEIAVHDGVPSNVWVTACRS